MGRSPESPALFGDPRTPDRLPVEIRGCPWTPVESGLICLGRLIINIGITWGDSGGVWGTLLPLYQPGGDDVWRTGLHLEQTWVGRPPFIFTEKSDHQILLFWTFWVILKPIYFGFFQKKYKNAKKFQ